MSAGVRDPLPSANADAVLRRRPSPGLGILLDGGLAVVIYFATYWLRFSAGTREAFLPGARSSLLFVVIGQLAALALAGAYARRPRVDWLVRVVIGVATGTTAAGLLLGVLSRLEGVSRGAFIGDAILLTIAALGWRGAWALRARAQSRFDARAAVGDLVDHTEEMATLAVAVGSLYRYRELLKNLVLKDIKLKYRGSVFGFLWSLANPLLMMIVYTVAFTVHPAHAQRGIRLLSDARAAVVDVLFQLRDAMSTGAIVDNAGLLKSVLFPRAILPIGTVLFNLAQYLLTMIVFLPLDDALVPRAAVRADAALPVVSGAAGRVHDGRRADSRDGDGFFQRRPAPARSRARRAVLVDAHRLRAARRCPSGFDC